MSNESNNFGGPAAQAGSPDLIDELQLMRYLDGRLDGAKKQEVEELLRTSAAARRRLDALREEDKLLRESLETLSEPSKRLSDKVIATLHTEERFRLQAIRNKRLRRNLVWGMAVAASFVLCVLLMRPRESMGNAVAGTGGTIVLPTGERRVWTKNASIYERDQVITAQGQFLRVQLSADGQIDLDERSRLTVEKSSPDPTFRLDAGRMGVTCAKSDMVLHLPQGTIRVLGGSVVDVWLPTAIKTEWPAWILSTPNQSAANAREAGSPAIVTVISGTINIANEGSSEGTAISQGNRVTLKQKDRKTLSVDLAGSRVVETRRGNSWHAADGTTPQDRALIGLCDRSDFKELGQRLGMTRNTPQAIADALAQLQDGVQTADAAARAEKLAAGQQALRAAYEPLVADDERRDFGRMLEGLAHLERGRTLMAKQSPDLSAAHAAFDAARVAFEEALRADTSTPESRPEWSKQVAAGPSVTLRDLSPAHQSALLASFNHAIAKTWLAVVDSDEKARGTEAAKELEVLRGDLSKAVEGMGTRLANGVALQATGRSDKAIEAFSEVLAMPMAGWSETNRSYGDGLKQAALVSLVRIYTAAQQPAKARAASDDFNLLYPLDDSSPAAQEIRRVISNAVREAGDSELKAGHFEAAVDHYSDWLRANPAINADSAAVHISALKAAIAGKDGEFARHEAKLLSSPDFQKHLGNAQLADVAKLAEQAKALPAAEKPADLPKPGR